MAILAAGLYDNTKGVVCDHPVEAVNDKLRRGKLRAFTPSGESIPRVAWRTKEARPGQRLLFSRTEAMELWPNLGVEEAEQRALITDRTLDKGVPQFVVTRERIRQIEATALRKLKRPSVSRKLRSFLDT